MTAGLALNCQNLYKRYGGHEVLHGIDLQVDSSNIHGLVGLNGAGKTTTLECLLGLNPYDQGTISLLGYAPKQLHHAKGKIAVVFDSPCLHPQLTVRQTLEFARLQNVQSNNATQSSAEVEKLLGVERYSQFTIRQLSLGNRRRVSIAQALINRPSFLILDEPFNGLDAGGVEDVLQLVRQLNQQEGTSFLLASHQLSYLEKICSHMAILHEGKICVNDSLDDLLRNDHSSVLLHTGDNQQARVVISQLDGVTLCDETESEGIQCTLDNLSSAAFNAKLVSLGIDVEQLILQKPSLETLFYDTVEEQAA